MLITIVLALQIQLAPINVAPGVWAMPNLTVGQKAYDACGGGFACEAIRADAIKTEAVTRWKGLWSELIRGKVRSDATLRQRLAYYKLSIDQSMWQKPLQ